jgi:hypothetical protein
MELPIEKPPCPHANCRDGLIVESVDEDGTEHGRTCPPGCVGGYLDDGSACPRCNFAELPPLDDGDPSGEIPSENDQDGAQGGQDSNDEAAEDSEVVEVTELPVDAKNDIPKIIISRDVADAAEAGLSFAVKQWEDELGHLFDRKVKIQEKIEDLEMKLARIKGPSMIFSKAVKESRPGAQLSLPLDGEPEASAPSEPIVVESEAIAEEIDWNISD